MATWRPENSMLTQRGVEILNKLKAGVGSITVTRIVAGSGRVAESLLYQQTSISGVQKPMIISGKNTTDVGSEITFYIENKDFAEPYDLHQIGIYVTHPDYVGEQLYHISQCDANDYDTIPAISYTPVTQGYSVFMEHGNSSSVNITVDPSGMINTVQFNEFKESTNSSITALNKDKAPAGYGIGEENATRVNNVDINTLTKGGTYYIGTGCTNTPPNTDDAWSTLHVIPGRACTQIYIPANDAGRAGTFSSWIARIYNDKTAAWGEWEWFNPPMDAGVEYRTTERINRKAVYKKNVNGAIQYRLDGETNWKPYTDVVGAAPAGYGLGTRAEKSVEVDFNSYINNGVYGLGGDYSSVLNAPTQSMYGLLFVTSGSSIIVQDVWAANWGSDHVSWIHYQRVNSLSGDSRYWSPWRIKNPLMMPGVEYMTDEEIGGKAVYKRNINGVIQYRLDGETDWKPYANAVGAYSKNETNSLLQNKLTNPGWWHPIYVAKTGSDTTGDGSESKPYLTIQHALDVAPRTPACLRIHIGSGTYNENVKIRDFASIEISSQDANNPVTVNSIGIDRCAACFLAYFNVVGVLDETYRASVAAFDSIISLHKITCTGNDLSNSPYGGGFRFQNCLARITDCTISNKFIAISAVSSTVYLDNDTTGTGNTTALRSGDGYGGLPAIIMKGNSTISGAESTGYGGKIW